MRTVGQRPRRTIARICIAVSFAVLAAVVVFPAFRHDLPGGGWLTVISAAVSILSGVVYLGSTRSRP